MNVNDIFGYTMSGCDVVLRISASETCGSFFGFRPEIIGHHHDSWWIIQEVSEDDAMLGIEVGDLVVAAQDWDECDEVARSLPYCYLVETDGKMDPTDPEPEGWTYYYFHPLDQKEMQILLAMAERCSACDDDEEDEDYIFEVE